MRYVVTGPAGSIGSQLDDALQAKGQEAHAIDCLGTHALVESALARL